MAIAFDNAQGTATTGTANVRTWTLTATSGAVLIVFTSTGSGQGTVSAVAANGNALTQLGAVRYRTAAPRYMQIWGLTAPPSGNLSISAVVAAGEVTNFVACGVTYVGQKTDGSPFGGVVTHSASVTGQSSLVVSATTDNIVVVGAGWDDGSGSAISPLVKRFGITGGGWPYLMITDAPGALSVTGSVDTTAATTFWGLLGINLIASTGAATITGSMSAVESTVDTFASTAQARITSRLSATDALDTFAASGAVRISGRLSATDATDVFVASAQNRVSGRLSATDALDTFAASSHTRVTGRLSATDAGNDTLAATGYNLITGRLSATDANADTFAASGYALISGRLSATDAPDIFAASGYAVVSGRLSAIDAQDIFFANGSANVPRSASIALTDAPDTFAATGYVVITGSLAATDNPDTVSITTPLSPRTSPGAGGGGKRKSSKPPYIPANRDFWDARERYLKSLQPEIESEPEPAQPEKFSPELPAIAELPVPQPQLLETFRIERTQVLDLIPLATSMRQLRELGARLIEANRQIAEQKRLELAARQAIEARRRARARQIRRLQRQAHAIELSIALNRIRF